MEMPMSVMDDNEDDVFPTNILPVDKPKRSLKVTRRAALPGPDKLRMSFLAMLGPFLQGGSCDGLGSQKPHPGGIRVILLEAQAQGLEPKLLYQQVVQARPASWPSAPSFEEVMPSGNARPSQPERDSAKRPKPQSEHPERKTTPLLFAVLRTAPAKFGAQSTRLCSGILRDDKLAE